MNGTTFEDRLRTALREEAQHATVSVAGWSKIRARVDRGPRRRVAPAVGLGIATIGVLAAMLFIPRLGNDAEVRITDVRPVPSGEPARPQLVDRSGDGSPPYLDIVSADLRADETVLRVTWVVDGSIPHRVEGDAQWRTAIKTETGTFVVVGRLAGSSWSAALFSDCRTGDLGVPDCPGEGIPVDIIPGVRTVMVSVPRSLLGEIEPPFDWFPYTVEAKP